MYFQHSVVNSGIDFLCLPFTIVTNYIHRIAAADCKGPEGFVRKDDEPDKAAMTYFIVSYRDEALCLMYFKNELVISYRFESISPFT